MWNCICSNVFATRDEPMRGCENTPEDNVHYHKRLMFDFNEIVTISSCMLPIETFELPNLVISQIKVKSRSHVKKMI